MLFKSRNFINKYHFSFNKQAIVPSYEDKDLSKQINQETRRVSKFKHYPLYIKLLIITVAIYYILLLYNLCILNFGGDMVFALVSKVVLEFVLVFGFLVRLVGNGFIRSESVGGESADSPPHVACGVGGGRGGAFPSNLEGVGGGSILSRYLLIFPLAELLYIPYFLFFGIKGTFGRYKWKS
jgi:hypothetical protein